MGKVIGKIVVSVVMFAVLMVVAAAASELFSKKLLMSQLFMTLLIPSIAAIWLSMKTSDRILTFVLGTISGSVVWLLGVSMIQSGSYNPLIIGAVTSGSMLVSGLVTFAFYRKNRSDA